MDALVCIDFINDIMDPKGKLAGKGYPAFADRHGVVVNAAATQRVFRDAQMPVIHVRIGFDPLYLSQPKGSPLFGRAHEFQALEIGAWGTEFVAPLSPIAGEIVINKPRVSPFFGTSLEATLRAFPVDRLFLIGVSTDLAVSSAARDAHDRDFSVVVLGSACAAADEGDHQSALMSIGKIAQIAALSEIGF